MPGRQFTFGVAIRGDARGGVQALQSTERELRDLRREIARADQGVTRSRRSFDNWARGMLDVRNVLGPLVGVAGAGMLARMSRQLVSSTAELDRMSSSLGVSVEAFQELEFAFTSVGAKQQDLSEALSTLSDRAQDAVDGAESMREDFALVGLEVDDLRGKRPDELFRLFAEAVASTEDPTKRTAAVMRALGDDLGQRLLPLLREGSQGLRDYAAEAQEAGAVMDEEMVASVRRFDEWLNRASFTMETRFKSALGELIQDASRLRDQLTPVEQGSQADLGARVGFDLDLLSRRLDERRAGLPVTDAELRDLRARIVRNASDLYQPQRVTMDPIQVSAADPLNAQRRFGGVPSMDMTPSVDELVDQYRERQRRIQRMADETLMDGLGTGPGLGEMQVVLPEVTRDMDELREAARGAGEPVRELNRLGDDLGMTFASAFEDAILNFKDFNDVVTSGLRDIQAITHRPFITARCEP